MKKEEKTQETSPRKFYNLVIGLSGPYGSGCSSLVEELVQIIKDWPGCYCERVQVSYLIELWHDILVKDKASDRNDSVSFSNHTDVDRRERLQRLGNDLRYLHPNLVGELVANHINSRGRSIEEEEEKINEIKTLVWIVDSLKNNADLKALRAIYKDEFFFCFITANTEVRWRRMRDYKSWKESEKAKFLDIDAIDSDEKQLKPDVEDTGQQVQKLSGYADYYVVNNATREDLKSIAYRLVCLLFGLNINQPTKDEKSMHLALSAANQSACLSRQVGAAIFNQDGSILAIGHNDVPKANGGLYSIEDQGNDHRCLNVGNRRCINDTNKDERFKNLTNKINSDLLKYFDKIPLSNDIHEMINSIISDNVESELNKLLHESIKNSEFKDATEYCRAVHAEMDALLSVCRNQSGSTIGSTVYVTTQPCHNCVKHLIAAGVKNVVFIEPYPKSLGEELHSDAISLNPRLGDTFETRICFSQYHGVAPRRYHDLFDKDEKRKQDDGKMCYRSKQEVAERPKFSKRIDQRTRLKEGESHKDLITVHEIRASHNVTKILEQNKKEESREEAQPAGDTPRDEGRTGKEDHAVQ